MSTTTHSGADGHRDRAERLFEEALSLAPTDRAPFINNACADDATLAAELLSLLEHARRGEELFARLAEVVSRPVAPPALCAGRYEIRGLIGAGGMGAVYRAHDTRLDRAVALKFLPPHVGMAPDADARLLREARAAAALEHVNICTVHEINETDDGWPFIAMALYEGETLKERLGRGPLPPSDAVDIAVQVARGLAEAHAHGIVHRDVKPGNIMLTAGGTVKLLDFGLATLPDAHVMPGQTPGTVPYMSPEQTRGEALGAQSDLWSLGVVIYEMLAGVRPFGGESHRDVVDAIRSTMPAPLRERAAEVPASLERIVGRLLDKELDRRHRDAAELIADLMSALGAPEARATPSRGVIGSWTLAVLLLFAVLTAATGAAAGWWSARRDSSASGTRTSAATPASPRTLALLPFSHAPDDSGAGLVSDGLTQELASALSRLRSVRIVGRRSAARLEGDRREPWEIGRALRVSTVLVGSVQHAGGRLRVTARLVDVADGAQLWSRTYEQVPAAVAALQRELALRIANALELELTRGERERLGRPGTSSQEALAAYLRGRYFANQRTASGYRQAITYFERAIAADSKYGAPWAGLAAVYSQQGMASQLTPEQARERTHSAARRAIALDDGLAEAHAVLGAYLHAYDWDTEGAERELRRAVELDPNDATTRHLYGNVLRSIGRVEEAVAQQSAAVELDPLVPAFGETLAFTLLCAGRTDDALARVREGLELDSTYWRAHAVLGNVFEAMHRYAEAMREYERAGELAGPGAHRTTGDIARVLAETGRPREAGRLLAVLQARAATAGIHDPAVATAIYASGDDVGAYDWLDYAYRQRQPELRFISCDWRFRPMITDRRFVDLLRKLRLRR